MTTPPDQHGGRDRARAAPTGGDRRQPAAARRHAQGHRRVRLRQRPVDGRHALGRHPAQPAPARPDPVASTSTEALATPGVFAVLTARRRARARTCYGLEHQDQPVLAIDVVRYQGEPVALVAADHPEIARQAAKKIVVDYDVLRAGRPTRDAALRPDAPQRARRDGNLVRHAEDPQAATRARPRRSWSRCDFEVGMQDQAFLGPESGLAVPDEDGGVDLYVATQWLHVDQRQICPALGLPPGAGAAHARRRRRRVRRPRGPVDARARLPARAAHRQAGEDGLQPRGVVLRARAPPPGVAALRVRRRPRREAGLRARPTSCSTAAPTPRRTPAVVGNAGTMGLGPYGSRTSTSTATAPTRTTRPAARCAGSAPCRPRSRTRR